MRDIIRHRIAKAKTARRPSTSQRRQHLRARGATLAAKVKGNFNGVFWKVQVTKPRSLQSLAVLTLEIFQVAGRSPEGSTAVLKLGFG